MDGVVEIFGERSIQLKIMNFYIVVLLNGQITIALAEQ